MDQYLESIFWKSDLKISFVLVEFVSKNQEKLKKNVEEELPSINALQLKVEFLEDRLKKAETLIDKLRNNGTHIGE